MCTPRQEVHDPDRSRAKCEAAMPLGLGVVAV